MNGEMKYISTREKSASKNFSECLTEGLADDGGLFVPEKFPHFELEGFQDLSFAKFANWLLTPFVAGSSLAPHLDAITHDAFTFPLPLKFLSKGLTEDLVNDQHGLAVLELFHGPTAAFKDVGARFLAQCQAHLQTKVTVIVATSGDTGGAVASAFANLPDIKVVILYPKGKISARQEKQLTNHGPSVQAFKVNGTFDDCQRVVKAALADSELSVRHHFMSANSISIGRLLPQMAYHAKSSLDYFNKTGEKPTLIIPTGNLGNAVAALWAKRCGFPIDHVILATNANRTLVDYFETGLYSDRPTVSTLANAMDVSKPSNFERLRAMYGESPTSLKFLKQDVSAVSVTDDEISAAISNGPDTYGEIWCPHTATAIVAQQKSQRAFAIICATAHPAKFETIVEPLIHAAVTIPEGLANTLRGVSVTQELEPSLQELTRALS